MAKKRTETVTDTVDTLRPYLERALKDEDFRKNVRDALGEARKLYGDLAKGNGGVKRGATKLATDKDVQENLRKTLADFVDASERIKGKKAKKSHKARTTMLLAGVVVGALYNPWTGQQTRKWLVDQIAGDDDLQPLEPFAEAAGEEAVAEEPAAAEAPKAKAAKTSAGEEEG